MLAGGEAALNKINAQSMVQLGIMTTNVDSEVDSSVMNQQQQKQLMLNKNVQSMANLTSPGQGGQSSTDNRQTAIDT